MLTCEILMKAREAIFKLSLRFGLALFFASVRLGKKGDIRDFECNMFVDGLKKI